jgi:MYND finger
VANVCRWDTWLQLIASGSPAGFCTIAMSLLPIAVVVVAFFFLFRLLGPTTQKSEQPQLPQPPQTPPPSHAPEDKHDQEPAPQPATLDGLASFRFESKAHSKPPTISPPRRHPCRVCGVPSTKRCLRCKSVYYCSREHSSQASLRCVTWKLYVPNGMPPKLKGLADTQTALFAKLGAQSLTLKEPSGSSPRCRRARTGPSPRRDNNGRRVLLRSRRGCATYCPSDLRA